MALHYKERNLEVTNFIQNVVKEIAEYVTLTMGPNGRYAVLAELYNPPVVTKDGVSVIKAIADNDPYKDAIIKLLLQVSEQTLEEAGDGTTTAICLAEALLDYGCNQLDKGKLYKDVEKDFNRLEKNVLKELNKMSEELNQEDIKEVATISANGDIKMGELIQKAFDHSDNVKIEEGTKTEDEVETINGMILNTGYLDNAFITNPEKDAIMYKDPLVFIVEGTLNNLKPLAKAVDESNGKPVIIIADDVNPNTQILLRDNFNKGVLQIGLMKTPGFGGHRKNLVNDLIRYTGARLVRHDTVHAIPGKIDSISISKEKTIITKKYLSTECKVYVDKLKELYKNKKDDLLAKRISNLNGSISIIKVGGLTPAEVKEKFDRYDDAVKAVACAIEEGIVPGGGQALSLVSYNLRGKIKAELLEALDAPINTIEKNSDYSLKISSRDMMSEKIFDPTKVTKTAIKNALSVSKLLLNSGSIILDRALWK